MKYILAVVDILKILLSLGQRRDVYTSIESTGSGHVISFLTIILQQVFFAWDTCKRNKSKILKTCLRVGPSLDQENLKKEKRKDLTAVYIGANLAG